MLAHMEEFFEVEFCGTTYAAKEIHSIQLVKGVGRDESEGDKRKAFLTECFQSGALKHQNVVTFLGVYNRSCMVVTRYW